jgi:DNA-binding beta-propeller fold protein YncE
MKAWISIADHFARFITSKESSPRGPGFLCLNKIFFLNIVLILLSSPGFASNKIKYISTKHVRDIVGNFNQPSEVAVGKKRMIYVLDGANNSVKVFTKKGKLAFKFGKAGEKDGELNTPVGMDIDKNGNIYVADTGNRRIQVFSDRGRYLRKIDLSSRNVRPVEVKAVEETKRIYVSDANNHQVLCFSKDGTFESARGNYGEGPGEFMFPGMVDSDSNNNLYVVDILNGRLQVFDSNGKEPLRQISQWGVMPGQLFRPKGLAIDDRSFVYVSDSYTGIIQVFDSSGNLHGILAKGKSEFLRLDTPVGLAFDSKGFLYVVQMALNKVSVYKISDKK